MSKNSGSATTDQKVDEKELELLKTAAQTWLAQSGNPKPTYEFHARKTRHDRGPTRFKLEAMEMAAKGRAGAGEEADMDVAERRWDFSMSLWDSYEIVTLSKKLEANMAFEHPVGNTTPLYSADRRVKRNRERKKRLLTSLFRRRSGSMSSSDR